MGVRKGHNGYRELNGGISYLEIIERSKSNPKEKEAVRIDTMLSDFKLIARNRTRFQWHELLWAKQTCPEERIPGETYSNMD